jgi:hypothetical protein
MSGFITEATENGFPFRCVDGRRIVRFIRACYEYSKVTTAKMLQTITTTPVTSRTSNCRLLAFLAMSSVSEQEDYNRTLTWALRPSANQATVDLRSRCHGSTW